MARESIVLLKNSGGILPLSKDVKKIAVIGPNADDHTVLFGNYNGTPSNPISVLEGIENTLPDADIYYSKGSELTDDKNFLTAIPEKFLFTPDNKSGLLASYFPNKNFSGKPIHKRVEKDLEVYDEFGAPFNDLEINNFSVRWEGFISFPESAEYKISAMAEPHFKIFIDGKLIASEEKQPEFIRFLSGKMYKIRIDFVSDADGFYFILGHSVKNESLAINALDIAEKSDAIILALGISNMLEGESLDRKRIELPENQQTLLKKILKLKKPTVLVLLSGSAIAMDDGAMKVPAIIEAWYPGQSGGTAIADVLFGDYNPAGRLPVTFYKSTEQLPDYYDYSMVNRTYKFFNGEPLFPFGYGLSYTSFAYDNLKLPKTLKAGDDLSISVDVTNSGDRSGEEVIQVYVKDVDSSVRTPIQSLQGFERIHLDAGETKTVSFTLTPKQLALLNDDMFWMVEPGRFVISVGGCQPGYDLITSDVISKSIEVTGDNYFINEE